MPQYFMTRENMDILRPQRLLHEGLFESALKFPKKTAIIAEGEVITRCQLWRAKRRLVVPSSREAALFSRRALRQRENKVGLRTRRPVIWEPSAEQQRACEVVA